MTPPAIIGVLVSLWLALVAGIASASPAHGAGPASVFYYESEPGNTFGQGTADLVTSDEAAFVSGAGEVRIDVTDWMVGATGPLNAKLVAGTTYHIDRAVTDGTAPSLTLSSQQLYGNCDDVDGSFTVHDVAYYGAFFSRLSLSFTVTCGDAPDLVHGELRFNTDAPAFVGVIVAPVLRRPDDLGFAPVGGLGTARTYALTNVGTGTIGIGVASVTGADAADFEVTGDTCAGVASLGPGASCTIGARLAPTRSGTVQAAVTIPVDTTIGARQVPVKGVGQTPTVTTIDGPSGWVWPPVRIVGRVSPSPTSSDGGASIWFTFRDADPLFPLGGPEPMMADGTALLQGTIPPGVHLVDAEFNPKGTGTWAPSRSETITVRVMRASAIALTSSRNPATGAQPPLITAKLDWEGYEGGELVLTDVTTGIVLERLAVRPGRQAIRIEPNLTAGDHLIRADFDGYEGVEGSRAELTQTITIDAGATFSSDTFYPEVDGYRDTFTVEAWRRQPVTADIEVRSLASGSTVRSSTYPPEMEPIAWRWDGTNEQGSLVAAGDYRVKVTFQDGGGLPKVVKRTVTVSRESVVWRTRSVTLTGDAYALVGTSADGRVSRARSSWPDGVWLDSGSGSASVSYAFPVVKADVYGKFTFKVNGRSTNGHKAVVAIWNPALGGPRSGSSYDAAKLVGPEMRWWRTSVPSGEGRVRKGVARGMVAVAKGSGGTGPAAFDVRQVTLVYRVGTLVRAGSTASGAEVLRDQPPLVPELVGERASLLVGDEALPVMRPPTPSSSLLVTERDAEAAATAGPVAATGPASFALEESTGSAFRFGAPGEAFFSARDWGDIPYILWTHGGDEWRILAAGPGGARLEAGRTYRSAVGYLTDDRPYFQIVAWTACAAPSCAVMWADFTVHDVAYDAEGRFERLSLSFTLRCTAATGDLRFNTATPAYPAIAQEPMCKGAFDDTLVGEESSAVAHTITNVGSGPVTFGGVGLVGRDQGDFRLVRDTCSGQTLPEGGSCTVDARFRPTMAGSREAWIGISMDFGTQGRMVYLGGRGKVETTTTIIAPTSITWSPVRLEAAVTPNLAAITGRGFGVLFEFPDDPSYDAYVTSDLDGHARMDAELPPGDHRVRARFPETDDHLDSRSETIVVHVAGTVATSVDLTADPITVVTTQRPTITAVVAPAGITGGELRIRDEDTGELLGSMTVRPGDQALTVTPLFDEPGVHEIVAIYLGHEQYGRSSRSIDVRVDLDDEVIASVTVDPPVFYPTVDGFRDVTRVTVQRGERLAVEAEIVPDSGGPTFLSMTAPPGRRDVTFEWDGQADGGSLAPSGYYTLRVRLTDDQPNTRIVERRLVLSHDWVEWTTRTTTVAGRDYALVSTTNDAVVSRSSSIYPDGVRLRSKLGAATVGYPFRVVDAALYGEMTLVVEGRSTNGHQAVAAVWNPALGGVRDLGSYDATVVIGPEFAKWRTSAPGADRVRSRKAHAVVSTWNGLGAPGGAVFDVKVVRLRYQVGTIHRVTHWSSLGGAGADLRSDYLEDVATGEVGRRLARVAGGEMPRRLATADSASLEPAPSPKPVASPPPRAVEQRPGSTPTSEPTPRPEPMPPPEPPVDTAPSPESAPSATPPPKPEPSPTTTAEDPGEAAGEATDRTAMDVSRPMGTPPDHGRPGQGGSLGGRSPQAAASNEVDAHAGPIDDARGRLAPTATS